MKAIVRLTIWLRQIGDSVWRAPDNLRVWKRGVALLMAVAPGRVMTYLAILITISILPVLQVWLIKEVIDSVAVARTGPNVTHDGTILLAVLYALTVVLPTGLQPVQWTLAAWLQDRALAEVDRRLMQAGERLVDLYWIERPGFQDDLRLAREAALQLPRLFLFLQHGLGPALVLSGLVVLLAGLHPLIPMVLIGVAVPQLVAQRRMNRMKYEAMVRRSRAARDMDYYVRIATDPGAAKELRVFGTGDFFLQRFQERCTAALAEVSQIRLAELRVAAGLSGLQALGLAGTFWYVATAAGAGRLTLGDIGLYLNAIIQAEIRTFVLSYWFGFLYEAVLYIRGMFTLLDQAKPTILLPPNATGQQPPAAWRSGIELRQVSFRYPEQPQPAVEQVSTQLRMGQVTALVGANGAGKSTVVKLLTRMYDPDAGDIRLDKVPLWIYDLGALRRRIAVVFQDFACFALTLRENIAVGDIQLDPDDARVEQAAQRAGVDKIATQLPQGYATTLTRRFEGGVDLSGGEWQKVALARAFVREADLVILDEPTATLDAEAEEQLFNRFRELIRGKTALIISHRLSSVRMADHILVMEHGRIVEAGSHPELIALGGRYAKLYEMQASRYRDNLPD